MGKIFLTDFVDVQADHMHNFFTVVRAYNVTTVYISEKFGGSSTGQGKFIGCS